MTTSRNQVDPNDAYAGALQELRALSTAAGGTALTTTKQHVIIPKGVDYLEFIFRNFATGVVAQLALCPWLTVLRTQDNLATITDESDDAQDGDAATDVTLSDQSTAANGDYLFVGADQPFRGVTVDVDGANGNASVITVKYWDGSAWTDISDTDGTISAGASLGQDGDITWTVPTAWVKKSLAEINSPTPAPAVALRELPLYWTRWEWSAALDSAVTLNSIVALARSTAYAEYTPDTPKEMRIIRGRGPGGIAALEALMNAGTGNMIVNAGSKLGARGIGL